MGKKAIKIIKQGDGRESDVMGGRKVSSDKSVRKD